MDDGDRSAFNSAMEYCKELTIIRRSLIFARIEHNYTKYYDLLVSYYLSLSARLRDEKNGKPLKIKLQAKHDRAYEFVKIKYATYKDLERRGSNKVPADIWESFVQWEKEMRKDEDKLGLLMVDKSDPAFALGGGNY